MRDVETNVTETWCGVDTLGVRERETHLDRDSERWRKREIERERHTSSSAA